MEEEESGKIFDQKKKKKNRSKKKKKKNDCEDNDDVRQLLEEKLKIDYENDAEETVFYKNTLRKMMLQTSSSSSSRKTSAREILNTLCEVDAKLDYVYTMTTASDDGTAPIGSVFTENAESYICSLANRYGRHSILRRQHLYSSDPVKREAMLNQLASIQNEGDRNFKIISEAIDNRDNETIRTMHVITTAVEKLMTHFDEYGDDDDDDVKFYPGRRRSVITVESVMRNRFVCMCLDAFRDRLKLSMLRVRTTPTVAFVDRMGDCCESESITELSDTINLQRARLMRFVYEADMRGDIYRLDFSDLRDFVVYGCEFAAERWSVLMLCAKRAYAVRDHAQRRRVLRIAERLARDIDRSMGDHEQIATIELSPVRHKRIRWRTLSRSEKIRFNVCLCDALVNHTFPDGDRCHVDEHILMQDHDVTNTKQVNAKVATILFLSDSPFRDNNNGDDDDDDDDGYCCACRECKESSLPELID